MRYSNTTLLHPPLFEPAFPSANAICRVEQAELLLQCYSTPLPRFPCHRRVLITPAIWGRRQAEMLLHKYSRRGSAECGVWGAGYAVRPVPAPPFVLERGSGVCRGFQVYRRKYIRSQNKIDSMTYAVSALQPCQENFSEELRSRRGRASGSPRRPARTSCGVDSGDSGRSGR